MNFKTLFMLVVAIVLTFVAVALHATFSGNNLVLQPPVEVVDFESCVEAGNPVMESYPRQCRSAEGELFVEEIDDPIIPPNNGGIGGCKIGGCSSQLCGEESDDLISTCEWRESYACYQTAKCERQQNGECGWTQTEELNQCLMEAEVPQSAEVN